MPQRGCRIIPRLSSPGLTLPLNLLMWSGHSCPLAFDFALDLNETNNETKLFAGTNAPPHPRGDRLTAIVPEVPRAVTWGTAAARGRCTRPSVGEASRTPRRGRLIALKSRHNKPFFNAMQGICSAMLEPRNLFAFISLPSAAPIMVRESGVIRRDVAGYVSCVRRRMASVAVRDITSYVSTNYLGHRSHVVADRGAANHGAANSAGNSWG